MGTCTSTICDEEASSSNAVRAGIVEKVRVLLQLKRQRSILVEKGEEVKYNSNQQEDTTITYDEDSSRGEDPVDLIRQGVVGQRHSIRTPFGQRQLVYADYTASGRFLAPVEEFFTNKIAPLYANTHTEASATGAQTTVLREEARFIVAQNVNAPARKYATLFVGTGCSGAIEKMIKVLGIMLPTYADKKWKLSKRIPEKERPVVFIGPFEHHSNELSWRESLATVVVIPEDKYGCPNMKILEQMLIKYKDRKMKIGSFCAGSNVTGICIDTKNMAILLHKHNALAFFDFAGSGAYVSINVNGDREEESMDAIFMSPHKFIGGPGSTGVLIAKRRLFDGAYGIETKTPTFPGGGTITFVSPHAHDYEESIEAREDAGTPGIVQAIRTGLAFQVKQMVGSDRIEMIERHHCDMVFKLLQNDMNISLTGCNRLAYFDSKKRVPIFSFNVITPFDPEFQFNSQMRIQVAKPVHQSNDGRAERRASMRSSINDAVTTSRNRVGASPAAQAMHSSKMMLHPVFVVSILNDVYGIQARAGCSCTGPYGHRLFGLMKENNEITRNLRELTSRGYHMFKQGWARVNFNYFISDEELEFICDAIKQVGEHGWKLIPFYVQEPSSGLYIHRGDKAEDGSFSMVSLADLTLSTKPRLKSPKNPPQRTAKDFRLVLEEAEIIYGAAENVLHDLIDKSNKTGHNIDIPEFTEDLPDDIGIDKIWWATSRDVISHLKSKGSRSTSVSSTHRMHIPSPIIGIGNVEKLLVPSTTTSVGRPRLNRLEEEEQEGSTLLKVDAGLLRSSRRLSVGTVGTMEGRLSNSISASFRTSGIDRGTLFGSVFLAENPNMRSRG